MAGFWKRTKQAAHSIDVLPPRTPLAGGGDGTDMVYAHNPVYLEIGQGANSSDRGVGAIILLFGVIMPFVMLYGSIFDAIERYSLFGQGTSEFTDGIIVLVATVFLCIFSLAVFGVILYAHFFAPTDLLVRLDRKRQKVWIWRGNGPIEIDWNKLTPRVEIRMVNVYGGKVAVGQYAELGEDGEPIETNGLPNVFNCGRVGDENTSLWAMEYIRRYMEVGPHASPSPKPKDLLKHRPKWYAAVNFVGMADDWAAWKANDPHHPKPPWGWTIMFIVLSPILFPIQVTNWVALRFAPIPKWSKDVVAMHKADLAELAEKAAKPKVKRKPVIRVNGEIVEGD